jgi:hypothetical protein
MVYSVALRELWNIPNARADGATISIDSRSNISEDSAHDFCEFAVGVALRVPHGGQTRETGGS